MEIIMEAGEPGSAGFFLRCIGPIGGTIFEAIIRLLLARKQPLGYSGTRLLLSTQSNGMDSSSPKRHLGAKLVSDTTSKRKGGVTMKLSRVGIDLAKNVYQLHGVDRSGKTVWKRRLKRTSTSIDTRASVYWWPYG
jgi:hypothetical protein